ncbi:MAG: hypothetical protein RL154_287, partial [Pseudomonadota bacterium]
QEKREDGKVTTISGTGEATMQEIGLYNKNGDKIEVVNVGESVEMRIKIKVNQDLETLVLGYGLKDRLGQVVYGTNTWHTKQIIKYAKKDDVYNFNIKFNANLGIGSYSVQTALTNSDTHLLGNYQWQDLALVFSVINIDKEYFDGLMWLDPQCKVKLI